MEKDFNLFDACLIRRYQNCESSTRYNIMVVDGDIENAII